MSLGVLAAGNLRMLERNSSVAKAKASHRRSRTGPCRCRSDELQRAYRRDGSEEALDEPCGKTPHATLYGAILREITTKGDESRFVKSERAKLAVR